VPDWVRKKLEFSFLILVIFLNHQNFIWEETEETLGDFELPEAEISPHPLAESTKKVL
jgi:hypothetical protein